MTKKKMEGDENQRRKASREAHAKGKLPSELRETLGASKQRKEASSNASHTERVLLSKEGKRGPGTSGKPRPGDREIDPKRTNRWE